MGESPGRALDRELRWLIRWSRRFPRYRVFRYLARRVRKLYLRRERPAAVAEVDGLAMGLRPDDWVEGQLLFGPQFYEAEERARVAAELGAGDSFVDLGAHVGLFTLLAAREVGPSGCVVAVEANPDTHARLVENVRRNGFENVRTFGCGVSDRHEVRSLGLREHNSGHSSFLHGDAPTVEVDCAPLAALLEKAGLERVGGMKLDLEGFEYRVLQRFFGEAPRALWPRFVLIEEAAWRLAAAGGDAIAVLREHGYVERWRSSDRRWRNVLLTLPDDPNGSCD